MKESSSPIFTIQSLPEARTYNNLVFPLCLTPPTTDQSLHTDPSSVVTYISKHQSEIEQLLQKHSVLLFRGFASPTFTASDFSTFIEVGLNLPNFPYVGGNAVRTPIVSDRVFTANESPPSKPIPFHHELAQTPSFPRRLLFFCDTPATEGGETPVVLSPIIYKHMQEEYPEFVQRLEEHGVVYSRVMTKEDRPESAIGRGWKATFGVECREEVEEVLRSKGYQWEWIGEGEDAMLREISPVLKAVRRLEDGRMSFFNQMFAVWGGWRDEFNSPESCLKVADGKPMDQQAMVFLGRVLEENSVAVPWRKGDVMYIDNMSAQHSRREFSGKRRVLASLVK